MGILVVAHLASSLKCFKKDASVVDCKGDENSCKYIYVKKGTKDSAGCDTAIANVNENQTQCSFKDDVVTCYCMKDKCNSSPTIQSSLLTIVAAVAIAFKLR